MATAQSVLFRQRAHLSAGTFEVGAIERILHIVRDHLGMEVAFASHISDGKVVIQYADTNRARLLEVGDVFAAEDGYCQRIIDGRLPYLITDASKVPEVAHLAATRDLPIGAHISVPLRLSDGSIHGTFCAFSRQADPTLNRRDLKTLEAFAELAAGQIEAEIALNEQRQEIIKRVSGIVETGQITMMLQPICRLADGKILGFEALARFADHDERPPSDWFLEAQEVGYGRALELTAVRAALRAAAYLPDDLYVSLNVSPDTLLDDDLADELDAVTAGRVVIEVTEHKIVEDYPALRRAIDRLRDKFRIAVDDAGAGYSGLRHILDLKPDIIKLDLSLTREIHRDTARSALAAALVAFGRDIGCQIIAEGVENGGECDALRDLGVDAAQGHHFFPALTVATAAKLVTANRLPTGLAGAPPIPH